MRYKKIDKVNKVETYVTQTEIDSHENLRNQVNIATINKSNISKRKHRI
jgi:hypothetical protein